MTATDNRPAGVVLGAATAATGLMAGLFYAFDVAVLPGLRAGDDRTYETAMRNINEAIENPVFAATHAGVVSLPATAAILQWRAGNRRAAAWALAGAAGCGAALALTSAVNVPLNRALATGSGRSAFDGRWSAANRGRTLACTVALACLARSLILHDRRSTT